MWGDSGAATFMVPEQDLDNSTICLVSSILGTVARVEDRNSIVVVYDIDPKPA
jgi:hypothetical protein